MKITLSHEEILQILTFHLSKEFDCEWRTDESYQIAGDISFWGWLVPGGGNLWAAFMWHRPSVKK